MFMMFITFCGKSVATEKSITTEKNVATKLIKINKIDYKSFINEKINNIKYNTIGSIVKIIKLETKNNSIIGRVRSISMDRNGSFLIIDNSSSKKMFLFDKEGKHLLNYGKPGPGPKEYLYGYGAAAFEDGSVVLVTAYKLIKFNKEGKVLEEVKIKYGALDHIVLNNKLYLSISIYQNYHKDNSAILIYNSKLEKIGGINKFDNRLRKMIYQPLNIFTKINKKIAFISNYDLNVNIYNPLSNELSILKIPNNNKNIEHIWDKKHLKRDDKEMITDNIHRFIFIRGFNNSLLLLEKRKNNLIINLWLLNLKSKTIKIFPYLDFNDNTKKIFSSIKGSYDNGLIVELSFRDEEEFESFKKEIPQLKNFEFNMDDNSFLALYEFKNS